jgi:hypothetical protein
MASATDSAMSAASSGAATRVARRGHAESTWRTPVMAGTRASGPVGMARAAPAGLMAGTGSCVRRATLQCVILARPPAGAQSA